MVKVLFGLGVALALMVGVARFWFYMTAEAGTDQQSVIEPWSYDRMEFVTWNNEKWTAWIRSTAFVHLPQNTRKWSRHSSPKVAFVGWDGEPWQAKVDGDEFVLAHRGDWSGQTERASAIRYKDWAGRNQLRTVAQLRR